MFNSSRLNLNGKTTTINLTELLLWTTIFSTFYYYYIFEIKIKVQWEL